MGLGGSLLLKDALPAKAAESDAKTCAQIEPGAGAWRTWVLSSGSAINVPPPPGASDTRAELKQLKALASARSAAVLDNIDFWNTGSPVYRCIV